MGCKKKCDRASRDDSEKVSRDEDEGNDDERKDQSEALDSFLTAILLTPPQVLPSVPAEEE